ncbi:MAG: flagellar basal-body MS-ring/collar protein FliF [Planctomycetota bacterium]|nr:flagellar basal-body MS-ring/collar protein FliF [Planctomycetota bacterium]
MSKFWQQLLQVWSRLETAQRATIVLASLAALVGLALLAYHATRPSYQLLAKDLTRARTAEIVAYLEQQGVPYRVVDRETAVLVPSQHIYRLRNELAQQDLLGDGGKGFELLDKSSFMMSTFQEHRSYDRAVAGELERSFRELPGVRSARVIIDRPQPSPFIGDDSAKPRASIKLDLVPGVRLTERQIAGIIALTAGAVAGLDHERVEVMDNSGLLTPKSADSAAGLASTTLEAEAARDAYLTRKAQEQLDAVLGPGRGRVKVSVKLDFAKRSESSVDPTKSLALTERTLTTDKKSPVQSIGGVAGTAPNVENEGRAAPPAPQLASETSEETQTSYFVGQRKVTVEDEVGRIRGMTVSILLPYKTEEVEELDAAGKPTGRKTQRRVPYTAEEQKRFESLVLNAIGFEAARDIVAKIEGVQNLSGRFSSTVQSMDLYEPPPEPAAQAMLPLPLGGEWLGYGLVAAVALGLLLVAHLQLRRSHRAWKEAEERARKAREAEEAAKRPKEEPPSPEEELQRQVRSRRQELKDSIKRAIMEDPNAAAAIVRRWLYDQE